MTYERALPFDYRAARAEFPILKREVNGRPLVYLDSAASAQKPRAVIDAMVGLMEGSYANVHRGLHTLANETTDAYESARRTIARFINAPADSVIFTKGATGRSTSSPPPLASACSPATRSSSPSWSTTPTWFHGTSCASARVWS